MNRFLLKYLPLVLVVLVCIPIVIPYFKSGYFPTHDGEWAVVRLGDMFRTLRDMQLPPRFSGALNFGYGYPLFNFAYPFPYYLGILLYVPFHSFVLAVKALFVSSVFLSAITMYFASTLLWKSRVAGVISSILYIYLPYRMVDLYVRGSIGESLAFAIFPLLFYLALKLFDTPYSRIIVCGLALSVGALVLTHNIMAVLFMPLFIIFFVARSLIEKRFDVIQSISLCLALGVGVSFYFWFPAIFEKGNILLSKIPIADRSLYFVSPMQLITPSWGYGTPTEQTPFTYQLGIAHITVLVIAVFIVLTAFVKNKLLQTPHKKYAIMLLLIYLAFLTMLFSVTGPIWEITPLLKEINYPWTILSQLGFIASILGGFVILQGRYVKGGVIAVCIFDGFLTLQYAKPESYINRGDDYYLTNEATTTSSSELMPLWVKDHPKEHFKEKVIASEGIQVSNLFYDSQNVRFNFNANQPGSIRVNTIYYPGWQAFVGHEQATIDYNNPNGVMVIPVPQGQNKVTLKFTETRVRAIANTVSLASMLIIGFILLRPLLKFK